MCAKLGFSARKRWMDLIKNKEKVVKKASGKSKRNFLKAIKVAAAVTLGTAVVGTAQVKLRTFSNDLIPMSRMERNIESLGLESPIIEMKGNMKARFMFPKNGKVSVNVHIPESELEKTKPTFVDAINEINNALTLVNPKFKLVLDFEPKGESGLYSIDVYNENLSKDYGEDTLAYWQDKFSFLTFNGIGIYKGNVVVDLSRFSEEGEFSASVLQTCLVHEIAGHGILRLGDAYNHLSDFSEKTIMGYPTSPYSGSSAEKFKELFGSFSAKTFSKYDLQVLMAKYARGKDYIGWDKDIEVFLQTTKKYDTLSTDIKYISENKDEILRNALANFPELSGFKGSEMVGAQELNFSVSQNEMYSVLSLSPNGGDVYYRIVNFCMNGISSGHATYGTTMLDGVLVGPQGKYYYECRDKVIEIDCKTLENGEKVATVSGVHNLLTKEESSKEKNELQRLLNLDETYGLKKITASARKYLEEQGLSVKPIEAGSSIIDHDTNQSITIFPDHISVYKNYMRKDYVSELYDGFVVTEHNEIITNTNDGFKVLDVKLDAKNLDAVIVNCRDCKSKTAETTSKSSPRIR